LQVREDAASLDRHREINRVDRADAVHAAEDILPVLGRDAAADEAGVAALRHDRQSGFGADPHHRRDFRGRSGADDEPCRAAPEAPGFDEIGFALAGVGNPTSGSNHPFYALQRRLDLHPLFLGPGHAMLQPMIVYIWPIG